MKGIIAFALLCLVASSVSVTGKHHSEKSHGLSKLNREVCTTTCTPSGDPNSTNWIIVWQGKVFVYNGDDKWFAFFDIKANIAFIFDAKTRLAGIFNLTTKGGLVISFATGYAVYVDVSVSLSAFASKDYAAGFAVLLQVVISNAGSVGTGANVTVGLVFDLVIVLKQLGSGGLDAVVALQGRLDLLGKLKASFGVIFTAVGRFIADKSVDVSAGVVVIFVGIIDIKSAFGAAFIQFISAVFTRVDAQILFDAKFFALVQAALTNQVEADIAAKLQLVTSAALWIGNIYNSVSAAIAAITANTIQIAKKVIVELGGVPFTITSGLSASKSYTISIVSSSLSLIISYNVVDNSIIIFNVSSQFLAVFVGKAGFWGIFNTSSGIGIAISKLTGLAVLVETSASGIAAAFASGSTNLSLGFQLVASATAAAGVSIGTVITGGVFSLSTVIASLKITASSSIYAASIISLTIRTKVISNFGALFASLNVAFQTSYSVVLGPINILTGIFTTVLKNVVDGLVKFFYNIVFKLNGFFTSDVTGSFYNSFQIEISASFSGTAITALNGLFGKISAAVSSFAGAAAAVAGVFTAAVSGGGSISGGGGIVIG